MPKKTLDQISKSGNDYVVKVKGNQKMLLNELKEIQLSKKNLDKVTTKEINRGREEKRIIKTYRVSSVIKNNWSSAKTIVYIKRECKRGNKKTITDSYYLSSLSAKAKEFSKGIRHHWGIENRLHYVKDVVLKEDESKIRSGNAPGIISLIRNLIINVARINGENRIRKFIRQCSGNINLMASLLE